MAVVRGRCLAEARRQNRCLLAERAQRESELEKLAVDVGRLCGSVRTAGVATVDFGDFERKEPFSEVWGADRGRCIDRFYIEQFLERHAVDICGVVLEVHDSDYTSAYGRDIVRSDVVDIDPTNPRATIITDLRRASAIASATYDCIILTQTLQLIYDCRAVLMECARILKPGGVLLATLPSLSRIAPEYGQDGDFWRFTASAAERLFAEAFPADRLRVESHGNVLVAIAYLFGLACHEVTPAEFQVRDPYFPLVITVRAETAPVERAS
jgi:SAM-dependent methyltransferase